MDREAEITKRIELLKKKNELLMQRHKEIEADRKSAENSGRSLDARQSASEYSGNQAGQRKGHPSNRRSRAHMDDMDSSAQSYPSNKQTPPSRGRGHNQFNRNSGASTVEGQEYSARGGNAQTPRQRGRGVSGRRNQDYDAKRMENFRLIEEEMAQGPVTESPDSAAFGVSRFLDDPRRKGELEPDTRWKSTRHKGNYGGLEFDNIKREMRGRGRTGNYERGRGRAMSRLQMSASMTGRERQDQERWQVMRDAADREIMARSKNTDGKWRREWDAEKSNETRQGRRDQGHSDYSDEWPRTHGGGRGRRRGSGSDRRGVRGGKSHKEEQETGKENRDEKGPTLADAEELVESGKNEEPSERPDEHAGDAKPQRNRQKQTRKDKKAVSPRHLAQQRAQTPSSKDGTEVWAQNSHHSDEAGQEWINGANRSTEQWLPSDEGNRKPAIDERMLEQQEDGATVYSRQLGRGWGDEKNIKATKAWVIDTEKAGTTLADPSAVETGMGEARALSFNKMHVARKNRQSRTEASRIKEEDEIDMLSMRSASPRLKRDNPGLTVEIRKDGGRRVKRYSEGDSEHVGLREASVGRDKKNRDDGSPVTSPVSAGPMKTPEGMKYVETWAEEMDMLSPTYESRRKQLAVGAEDFPLGGDLDAASETVAPKDTASEAAKPNSMAQEISESDEVVGSTGNALSAPDEKSKMKYELHASDSNKSGMAIATVSEDLPSEQEQNTLPVIESSCGVESPSTDQTAAADSEDSPSSGDKEAADGFKDANDVEEEDEFYECGEEDGTDPTEQDIGLHTRAHEATNPAKVNSGAEIKDHPKEMTSDPAASETGAQSHPSSGQPEEGRSVAEDLLQTSCQDTAGEKSSVSLDKGDGSVRETAADTSES